MVKTKKSTKVYRRLRVPPMETIDVLPQRGKSKTKKDKKFGAIQPGRRVSKSGNIYTETRKNRSDKKGKLV